MLNYDSATDSCFTVHVTVHVCVCVCVCKWRRMTPLTSEVNSMRALAKNEDKFVGGSVWLN